MKEIVLAGGCFWGVERYFDLLKGVEEVKSVYANGNIENPTYEMVCSGVATHAEAVHVKYNNDEITLTDLLNHFFRFVDPHSINKQGNDVGLQYRSGIYYYNNKDKEIIKEYIKKLEKTKNKKIVVEVLPLNNIYDAEEYHQNYLKKNPNGYCHVNLNLIQEDEKKS